MQKSELHKRVQKSELHKRDTGTYAASTPSSSAGDPCIFKSCPRLVRVTYRMWGIGPIWSDVSVSLFP